MTLTPEQKAELKAAAEKATQGPWYSTEMDIFNANSTHITRAHYGNHSNNTHYIAAANPATILSLLSEVERLQSATLGLLSPALHWEISHE